MPPSFKAKLIEKKQLTEDTYYFNFKLDDSQKIDFVCGQYIFFKIDNVTRLYSIASEEQIKDKLELIIKIHEKGIASKYFLNLETGVAVDIYGPAGFFRLKNSNKQKILIAFGTGIAPFRSMLKTYSDRKEFDVKLFWGLKTAKAAYCLNDFNEIKEKNEYFEYNLCLSRETDFSNLDSVIFKKGRVNAHLPINASDCEYYICGQQEVVVATNLFLLGEGVDSDNIFFEIY